jgi:hypothetical protein
MRLNGESHLLGRRDWCIERQRWTGSEAKRFRHDTEFILTVARSKEVLVVITF